MCVVIFLKESPLPGSERPPTHTQIAAPALRLQMMRRAEEEAKLAELEAEKAAKQAELDAAAGAAAEEAPPPAE